MTNVESLETLSDIRKWNSLLYFDNVLQHRYRKQKSEHIHPDFDKSDMRSLYGPSGNLAKTEQQ